MDPADPDSISFLILCLPECPRLGKKVTNNISVVFLFLDQFLRGGGML